MKHSCGGCTNTWTGIAMAHCASCHGSFSVVSNFDKHRRNGKCLDPAVVGLELRTNGATPTWAAPGDPDLNARFGRTGS